MKPIPLSQRLMRHHITEPNTGCWLWIGRTDRAGYGLLHNRLRPGGQNLRANRIAYEEWVGPIPDGLCVLHKCDAPRCINPQHLWLGSHKDNALDKCRKGRAPGKLTAEMVREILGATTEGPVALAKKYGVNRQTIHAIRTRKIWRHVSTAEDQDNNAVIRRTSPLTAETVLKIRAARRPLKDIAQEYGVDRKTIYNIKRRRTWAHL